MKIMIDLTGHRYGRLTVLNWHSLSCTNKQMWLCLCDCGNHKIVASSNLRNRHTASCGCYRVQRIKDCNTTHGATRARVFSGAYRSWTSMKRRCTNPNSNRYRHYGARGITICGRWLHSFENFLADMGERPVGTSIERVNNDGNYEPDNCKWATAIEQANNRRASRGTAS